METFNPSRFDGRLFAEDVAQKVDLGDNASGPAFPKIKLPPKRAFVPFSEGSRSCLGIFHPVM